MNRDWNRKTIFILLLTGILFVFVSISTQYYGHIDSAEYRSVAKYFAGEYSADIRSSHSLSYGLINAHFVVVFGSILGMKILNILLMSLIILSLYYISNKNKNVLILFVLSPLFWYSAPWIGPIQVSALLLLLGFSLLEKWDKDPRWDYLAGAGILVGLSWVFWNTILFIAIFLFASYFFDKKVHEAIGFILFVLMGLLPLLIMDYIFYNFPFYSILKNLIGIITAFKYGSIYPGVNQVTNSILDLVSFILLIPFFSVIFFKRKFALANKKFLVFISITILFFLLNPQIRYLLIIWPILILYLGKNLNKKQYALQVAIFAILSLIIINPYLIQIKYSTNSPDFTSLISNFGRWEILDKDVKAQIINDLNEIEKDYTNQTFVVGNKADDYIIPALLYSGDNIKEFVSIQDYKLHYANESRLFEKRIVFNPNINDRRRIWIGGGLEKAEDDTQYDLIEYGLGIWEPLELDNFTLIKRYELIHISKREKVKFIKAIE